MRKKIIILMMTFCLLVGCTNSKTDETINEQEVKIKQIQNLKTSDKEIPKFTIVVNGKNEGTITELLINDLQMYEFNLDVLSYDFEPNSKVYNDTWCGVKLLDVLKIKGIDDFDSIDFKGSGKISVRYLEEEINDTMYIVFYRNGVLLSETEESPAMLISPTLTKRYWVPSLISMDII